MAVEINTSRGPVVLATIYSPPRRTYLPIGEMNRLFHKNVPVYMIGDMNANHHVFGYTHVNLKGNILANAINTGLIQYKGPDFNTLVHTRGRPDIILTNRYTILNMAIQQGNLTMSDHVPLVIKLSAKPIVKEYINKFNYDKANWDLFKAKIDRKIEQQKRIISLETPNNITKDIIDNATQMWMQDKMMVVNDVVPKKLVKYYTHPTDSDLLRLLEIKYNIRIIK